MAVHSYNDLKAHWGHTIQLVCYGDVDDPDNVAIECITCNEVLVDFDKPNDVANAYPDGECPDCGDPIPADADDGSECGNCGHVFWASEKDTDDTPSGGITSV